MGVVVAVFHKAGQCQLQDLWRVTIHDAARVSERLDQLGGQNHVAHSQPGVERFAKGPQVDRALVLVQALHAGGRLPVVMKLAVVVVFDDPLALLRGPVDQFKPALQRQRRPRRVLMRRRDIDAIGAAAVCPKQVRADALRIDVYAHHPGFCHFKCLPGAEVARVFQQDRFTGVHQQLGTQVQGLTSTAQHQDLVRGAPGPTFEVQVGGDGLAQRLGTLRVAMQQHAGAIILHHLALQSLPHIDGERAGFRQAGGKGLDRLLIVHPAAVQNHSPALAQPCSPHRHAFFDVPGLDAPARRTV